MRDFFYHFIVLVFKVIYNIFL